MPLRCTNDWLNVAVIAALVPILIPAIQFGLIYKLWDEFNSPVNRKHCKNTCWDTAFKARYESGEGRYHHIYFNVTWQTFIIWTITVLAVITAYESFKYTTKLLMQGKARYRIYVLFVTSVFPHYYAWWAYFNYFNDDFYDQSWHQLFFSITETLSTICVLKLMDVTNPISKTKLLFIAGMAVIHIMLSCSDQFINNVIFGEGKLHQVLRDVGFMLPDVLNVCLPCLELKHLAKNSHHRLP